MSNPKTINKMASRKELTRINEFEQKLTVINFAQNHLRKIMNLIGVHDWALGGSVAGIFHGLDFGRVPHDIDVIVPTGTMRHIMKCVNESPFFVDATPSCSFCDDEWSTRHFAFRTADGPTIDIIEARDFEKGRIYTCTLPVMSLEHLVHAKGKYNRPKDQKDLEILKQAYNACDPDLLVLAELKAKMEAGV